MIEDYRSLAIFVLVADSGSFSEAARQLRVSKSVVSHHIGKLEKKLAISLFFRSSREMSLTAEGQTILQHARTMVEAGERALDVVSEASGQLAGTLRISAPAFGEGTPLRDVIWEFMRANPAVSVYLSNSDVQVDLVKGRFDLAIRIGKLLDSNLKCRRIADFSRVLVASKRYLENRPSIDSPDGLSSCDFIRIVQIQDELTLVKGQEEVTVHPANIRLEVDSISSAKSAVLAGMGFRGLPSREVKHELDAGELVQILPKWSMPIQGVYAVWSDTGPQKNLTRGMINFMVDTEKREQSL